MGLQITISMDHRCHPEICLGIANVIVQSQKIEVTWSGKHQRGMSALDMMEGSTEIFELALRMLVRAHSVLCCCMEIRQAWKNMWLYWDGKAHTGVSCASQKA